MVYVVFDITDNSIVGIFEDKKKALDVQDRMNTSNGNQDSYIVLEHILNRLDCGVMIR